MSTSIEKQVELSKSFGGIKSWYGLRARPCHIGATPKGQSARFTKEQGVELFPNLKDINNIRYGAICYPEILTDDVIASYEIIPLDKDRGIELGASTELEDKELKEAITNTLACTLNDPQNAFVFLELEQNGQHELIKAFKKTSIFIERLEDKSTFELALKCFRSITTDDVVTELTRIKKSSAIAALTT